MIYYIDISICYVIGIRGGKKGTENWIIFLWTATVLFCTQNGLKIWRYWYKSYGIFKNVEPISKIRLGFRARRETVKKRSIHVVCEHFEPFRNAAMGTEIVFEIGSIKYFLPWRSCFSNKKMWKKLHNNWEVMFIFLMAKFRAILISSWYSC